jgi:general stress protein 26
MASERDIEDKFWKSLKQDRTVMLGFTKVDQGHTQPMTAVLEDQDIERRQIWIFTSRDTDFATKLGSGQSALLTFATKGHDLFAMLDGRIEPDNDKATIERLWNPFIAAWFKGGKSDPKLLLMRFDPADGQIWLNENSVFAGIKMLMGADPKKDYADKVAKVRM